MALAARWVDPATIVRLRTLVRMGDPSAIRAAVQLKRMRKAPHRTAERRVARRAFERHATRALGDPDV